MSTDPIDLTMSLTHRTPGRRLNNFAATTSPTVNDDEATGVGDGYEVGSVWIDVVAGEVWTNVDATSGAAVWVQGSGGATSLHVDLSVSGSYDVDRDDGYIHDLTLVGNATLTPIATTVVAGDAIEMPVIIRQDAGGGNTLTWGGSIDWATSDGNPPDMPTAGDAFLSVHFRSVDDGATWIGYGPDPAPVVALDDLSDVTITAAADGDVLTFDGVEWVNEQPAGITQSDLIALGVRGELIITSVPAGSPLVFADIMQDSEGVSLLYAAL